MDGRRAHDGHLISAIRLEQTKSGRMKIGRLCLNANFRRNNKNKNIHLEQMAHREPLSILLRDTTRIRL